MNQISMTIHGLTPQLAKEIRARARAEGLSLNKTIKKLLCEALGVKPPDQQKRQMQFEEFCGAWSAADLKNFKAATADLRKIHPDDWK